jgi:hypothetical protein
MPPQRRPKPKRKSTLTFEQVELAALFTGGAFDNPRMTFDEVAAKILPKGFGKGANGKAFRKEAKETFDAERAKQPHLETEIPTAIKSFPSYHIRPGSTAAVETVLHKNHV